jgi:hypothetical protein
MAISYAQRSGKTFELIEEAEAEFARASVGSVGVVQGIHIHKRIDGYYAYDGEFDIDIKAGGIADALAKLAKLKDAILTVAGKGRAYRANNNRVTVHVWSKDVGVLRNVKEAFGGNYYRHGSGMTWMCSKKSDLTYLWKVVNPHLPDNHKLELLEEAYETEVKP